MRTLTWVDTASALAEVVEKLSGVSSLALDAEMDSYFVYHTKLCLVQLTAGQDDILIDSLAIDDLTPLNALTMNPAIRKVMHAGENDVPYFRGRGVTFEHLFDTHLAARLLDLESKSLAGLVERSFGVVMAKDQQRADWRLRPLPKDQVAYAREDTRYLNDLADLLEAELRAKGLQTQAQQAFECLERFEVRKKDWDPDGWAKIKGARELTGGQRTALAALFGWRETVASQEDLAAFRVVGNGLLLALARKRFTHAAELKAWAKSPWLAKHSEQIVALLEKARQQGAIPFPEVSRRRGGGLSPQEQACFESLRSWRNAESLRQDVPPERILSNRQLQAVARHRPQTLEAMRQLEGLEPWRIEQFGEAVLGLLKRGGDGP